MKRVQTGGQRASQRSQVQPAPGARALVCALGALALLGCNLENKGDLPPKSTLYFPNAIALSPHDATTPPAHLFVANSNFDLRYRNGTILTLSLDRLDEQLALCPPAPRCAVTESCPPPPDCIIPTASGRRDSARIVSGRTLVPSCW